MSYPQRVAARAADIQPTRALLSLLAAPFYALGFLVGILLVAVSWLFAAAALGVADARARSGNPPEADA